MSAWTDLLESDMGLTHDAQFTSVGSAIPANFGGGTGYIVSAQQVRNLCNLWQNPAPAVSNWAPSNMYGPAPPEGTVDTTPYRGHPRFINNIGAFPHWVWVYTMPGHPTNSNTGIEVRNLSASVLRKSTGQWQELFTGARCWGVSYSGQNQNYSDTDPTVAIGTQNLSRNPDSTYCWPRDNYGYEMWPYPSGSYPNVVGYYGAINKTAIQDAACFFIAAQVRYVLNDPSGVDDRASARMVVKLGFDLHATDGYWPYYYDWLGYPARGMSGTNSRWKRIYYAGNDWTWCTATTVADLMYEKPGRQPPWGAFGSGLDPYSFNGADGSITRAQFLANPPPVPTGFATTEPPIVTIPPIIVRPSTGTWFAKLDGGLNNWSTAASIPTPPTSLSTEEEDNEMLIQRNAATGANRTIIFRCVDATDGYTAETGLTFGAGDIKISKNGAAEANHSGTVTEIAGGLYKYEFAVAELDTPGSLSFRTNKSGVRPASFIHQVVAFDPYDASALGMTRLDATVSSRLPTATYETVDNFLDKANSIETGVTPRGALRLMLSILAGKLSGAGTGTEVFRNGVADTKARVTAIVDTAGNRTVVTTDQT